MFGLPVTTCCALPLSAHTAPRKHGRRWAGQACLRRHSPLPAGISFHRRHLAVLAHAPGAWRDTGAVGAQPLPYPHLPSHGRWTYSHYHTQGWVEIARASSVAEALSGTTFHNPHPAARRLRGAGPTALRRHAPTTLVARYTRWDDTRAFTCAAHVRIGLPDARQAYATLRALACAVIHRTFNTVLVAIPVTCARHTTHTLRLPHTCGVPPPPPPDHYRPLLDIPPAHLGCRPGIAHSLTPTFSMGSLPPCPSTSFVPSHASTWRDCRHPPHFLPPPFLHHLPCHHAHLPMAFCLVHLLFVQLLPANTALGKPAATVAAKRVRTHLPVPHTH